LGQLKKLSYITDLSSKLGGGGSYAVNWHIQEQLRRHFELPTLTPVVPNVPRWKKFLSRVQRRILKRPSRFFYFSPETLNSNAERAADFYETDVDAVFFRSATRWCHCTPSIPYFVYLDIVFHTFFENTFSPGDFIEEDLNRIFNSEARFLEGANAVFFESNWGLQKARNAYSLEGNHYIVANRGGVVEPPDEDTWSGEPIILLSIAMNFEQKGGDITFQAFKRLKERYPGLRWHIVGGPPTGDWEAIDGIVYEGLLNLDNRHDLHRYREILSDAFLLIHPTREDATPLVLTEAAYFGCPSISVNRFAIPELVLDGKTGVLLDSPIDPGELADAIERLIVSPDAYLQMRRAAFEFSRTHFDWNRIGERVAQRIRAVLE